MIGFLIRTAIQCLIGWILIQYVPAWLRLRGVLATIIRVIGVLVILSALFAWL